MWDWKIELKKKNNLTVGETVESFLHGKKGMKKENIKIGYLIFNFPLELGSL